MKNSIPNERGGGRRKLVWIGVILLLSGITICLACYISSRVFCLQNSAIMPPPAGQELQPHVRAFRVAAFSDFGARMDSVKEITASIRTKGEPDFTLCLGDMTKIAMEPDYAYVTSELHKEIPCALWAVPGNHDWNPVNGWEMYRRFWGQDYYSWSYGDTLFIALNTADRTLPTEQCDFLRHVLSTQRERFRRCVIVCHIPPIDLRPGQSYCMLPEAAESMQKIIADYKIDMIVTGHMHRFLIGTFAGAQLVYLPSSGQGIRDPENPNFGYVLFDFAEDGSIAIQRVNVTPDTGIEVMKFFACTVLVDNPSIVIGGLLASVAGLALLLKAYGVHRRSLPFPGCTQLAEKQ